MAFERLSSEISQINKETPTHIYVIDQFHAHIMIHKFSSRLHFESIIDYMHCFAQCIQKS